MLEYRDKHNGLLDGFQVPDNIVNVGCSGVWMDFVLGVVCTVFANQILAKTLLGLIKEVVFGSGQVNDDSITIVFCQSGDARKRHSFSTLDVSNGKVGGFGKVDSIVRVAVGQNVAGFLAEGRNGGI